MKRAFFTSVASILLSTIAFAGPIGLHDLMNNSPITHEKADSLRDFRVVIPGILYRGGNSTGGANPLNINGLRTLCEKGFSQAVYMYPDNFTNAPKPPCKLEYTTFGGGIKDRGLIHRYLSKVKDVIDGKQSGPLYIHCWNGWHASGEMAAYALMQFCGLNGDQAQAYWDANVPNGRVTRMKTFKTFEDLDISPEQQSRICPR